VAEDKPSTPEQQLLKLIEGQGQPGKDPASPASKPKGPAMSLDQHIDRWLGMMLGKLSFLQRSGKSLTRRRKMPTDIASINRAMLVVTALFLLYVVWDGVLSSNRLRRMPNFVPPMDMKVPFLKDVIEPLKETSYYLQKVTSRNIFREGRREAKAVADGPAVDPDAEANAAIQGLSLVGISWSSNPDAIIEDKANQRTFFVKRGQMVGDVVKVEAIFKDHVVLSYEDKEFELR
jgi:hypothetical protein